jgi:hypothetical protein
MSNIDVLRAMFVYYIEEEDCVGMEYEGKYEMHTIKEKEEEKLQYCLQLTVLRIKEDIHLRHLP